jgi:hypothetical protein
MKYVLDSSVLLKWEHDLWMETYNNPELHMQLLAQKRPAKE